MVNMWHECASVICITSRSEKFRSVRIATMFRGETRHQIEWPRLCGGAGAIPPLRSTADSLNVMRPPFAKVEGPEKKA